jgi:hypothetical protein
MKQKFLYTILLSIYTHVLFAQVQKTTKPGPYNNINKGYYSIGNKPVSGHIAPVSAPDTLISQAPSKGYYSIGTNKSKTVKKAGWLQTNRRRPVITKGYYSIGNNAEKLYGKPVK